MESYQDSNQYPQQGNNSNNSVKQEEEQNSQEYNSESDVNETNGRGGVSSESAGGGGAGEEGGSGSAGAAETLNDEKPQVYIQVAENEDEYSMELPCEPDGSMLLSTVTSQFPGASGLKYRNPDTNSMRAVRFIDGKFIAPEKGWAAFSSYYCVFPRDSKRKNEESEAPQSKSRKSNDSKCSDLIVLGLPWKITEKELKTYFEQFGQVDMVQIKKDPKTGQSKGFGFVRFTDYEIQMRVVTRRHNIQGRWCDVRVPLSKGEEQFSYQNSEFNRKIFVGRITDDFTVEDLRTYFKKFGDISDVFIPKPFRGFGFVTFVESDVAQSLCGEEHVIKGVSTQVSNAVPKVDFGASGYPGPVAPPPHHYHQHGGHHGGHSSYSSSYGNGGGNSYGGPHHHSHHGPSQRYNPYGGGYQDSRRSGRGSGGGYNAPPPPPSDGNSPMVNSTYNHGVNNQSADYGGGASANLASASATGGGWGSAISSTPLPMNASSTMSGKPLAYSSNNVQDYAANNFAYAQQQQQHHPYSRH